jgi:hypothetical protein
LGARDIAKRNVAGFAPGESSEPETTKEKPRCHLLPARPFDVAFVAEAYFIIMAFCAFM